MSVSYGKWTKHKLLLEEPYLTQFLPETKLFSRKSFWEMMDLYEKVIVKPCFGYRGIGLIQISALGEERYEIHNGLKKIIIDGRNETFRYVSENRNRRRGRYIVQEKILLAEINQCPFDIRVLVQRKRKFPDWAVTAKAAKVAARGFVITNAAKAVLTVETAIEKSIIEREQNEILNELDEVGLIIAQHLQKYYPIRRTLGIDMGIDQHGKVWIIEVNLAPDTSMFKKLEDKAMLNKITEYRKS